LSRLRREDSFLLVVDVQHKLAPAVHEGQRVIARCSALVRAARLLGVPVLLSEHFPDSLGIMVPELLAVASRRETDCAAAIERMRAAGGSIVTAEMVMFEWLHRADVPEWPELLRIVKQD
jgi:nicotinamidase-related amidase